MINIEFAFMLPYEREWRLEHDMTPLKETLTHCLKLEDELEITGSHCVIKKGYFLVCVCVCVCVCVYLWCFAFLLFFRFCLFYFVFIKLHCILIFFFSLQTQ